jgi:hypothetical protein
MTMSEVPPREQARPLAPRAAVALLTLQLRAAQKEAAAAEAEVAGLDIENDPALVELRARLAPLLEERRRALDAELAEARAAVESVVVSEPGRGEAVEPEPIVEDSVVAWLPPVRVDDELDPVALADLAASEGLHDEPIARTAPVDAAAVDVEPIGSEAAPATSWPAPVVELDPIEDFSEGAPGVEVDEADEVWSPWQRPSVGDDPAAAPAPLLPTLRTEQPVTVTLDPDAFAKVLAVAIATVIEQLPERPATVYTYPPYATAPAKKKSFWAHAWHADVMLAFVAMVIVIIVLLAWMA